MATLGQLGAQAITKRMGQDGQQGQQGQPGQIARPRRVFPNPMQSQQLNNSLLDGVAT